MAAYRERAAGRALAAAGDAAAVEHLEKALSWFGELEMPYECGRVGQLIARVVAGVHPETAVAEARSAFRMLRDPRSGSGCGRGRRLLRSFGVKAARAGPRRLGLLTKRELEVLALLREGLANRDIAARLFISRKTVEHPWPTC